MSTGALIFMLLSWTLVLGLMGWSFHRLLNGKPTTAASDAAAGTIVPPQPRPTV